MQRNNVHQNQANVKTKWNSTHCQQYLEKTNNIPFYMITILLVLFAFISWNIQILRQNEMENKMKRTTKKNNNNNNNNRTQR